MTSFEKHLGRPMKPNEGILEREYYVSLVLSPEKLKARWKSMGHQPKPKQLVLFESE